MQTYMATMTDHAELMSLDRFRSRRPQLPIILPDLFAAPQGTIAPVAEAFSEMTNQEGFIPASFAPSTTSQVFDSSDDQLAWPPEFGDLPTLSAVQPYHTGRYHAFIRNSDHFGRVKREYMGSNNKVRKTNPCTQLYFSNSCNVTSKARQESPVFHLHYRYRIPDS